MTGVVATSASIESAPLRVRKAAVLGAGVMGAQIAAHLVNADVDTILSTSPPRMATRTASSLKAIQNLGKLSPSPLGEKSRAAAIVPANYDDNLDWLQGCDLIIEAIAERLDWKLDLYKKIAPYIADNAVVASNTSGLSINALAEALPAKLRPRFSGIHFFNPPRYMHLVELIPDRENRSRDRGRPRSVPDDDARQGRRPCQGHAELHRQPHRRLLDSGDDASHRPRSGSASMSSTR